MGPTDGIVVGDRTNVGHVIFQKRKLMDYVMMSKMMKISLVWGSIIAFLGNYQKRKFDGTHIQKRNFLMAAYVA